ncbi:hypothetical protein [Streptomyces sp. NPDC002078]
MATGNLIDSVQHHIDPGTLWICHEGQRARHLIGDDYVEIQITVRVTESGNHRAGRDNQQWITERVIHLIENLTFGQFVSRKKGVEPLDRRDGRRRLPSRRGLHSCSPVPLLNLSSVAAQSPHRTHDRQSEYVARKGVDVEARRRSTLLLDGTKRTNMTICRKSDL